MDNMCNGGLKLIGQEACVVPYMIGNDSFDKIFKLVDGIYIVYGRFGKGYKQPITESERNYAKWQEGASKEIECAFGIFQNEYLFISTD